MKELEMLNGYVRFPQNWIVINYCQPHKAKYAGTVEIRNGLKYNAPHFIFFSPIPIQKISASEERKIIGFCVCAYPRLCYILNLYIPPIYDVNNQILNMLECYESPAAACFEIPELGTKDAYNYGAVIIRTSN